MEFDKNEKKIIEEFCKLKWLEKDFDIGDLFAKSKDGEIEIYIDEGISIDTLLKLYKIQAKKYSN